MKLNYVSFGKRIRAIRKKEGLSQAKLAEMIGISTTFMSYIENGIKSVSLETFINLANALHVPADDLLRDSLENTIKVANHEFVTLVSDCSEYEIRILLDTTAAMKEALRKNRHVFQGKRK